MPSPFTVRKRKALPTVDTNKYADLRLAASAKSTSKSIQKDAGIASRATLLLDDTYNRRKRSTVTKEQLELLYRIDGLTFRIVQKYIEKMLSHGYTMSGGTQETRKICQDFSDDIDLKYLLSQVITDIFIAGNGKAWTELGYTTDGTDIVKVTPVNPKSEMDFIREENNPEGDIIYDSKLSPIGYQMGFSSGSPKMEWVEDTITIQGDVVWRKKSEINEDGRDRIGVWKLIGYGDMEEGMSPFEPVYKANIIRLNLEDTVGNSAFRSLAIAAYVGADGDNPYMITNEQLDDVRDKLRDLDEDTVWAFRNNVELKEFPVPDIANYEKLMYYFADLASSSAGVGIGLILQPLDRGYRGDMEIKQAEFMDTVGLYQERLAYQTREILYKRLLAARGKDPRKAPFIKFRSEEHGIALSKARRLSTYARYGLLTATIDTEKYIREMEGIPALSDEDMKLIVDKEKREAEAAAQKNVDGEPRMPDDEKDEDEDDKDEKDED